MKCCSIILLTCGSSIKPDIKKGLFECLLVDEGYFNVSGDTESRFWQRSILSQIYKNCAFIFLVRFFIDFSRIVFLVKIINLQPGPIIIGYILIKIYVNKI